MVWDIFGQDRSVSWKWSVNLSDLNLYIDAKILSLWEKNHFTRYIYTWHNIHISQWKKPHAAKYCVIHPSWSWCKNVISFHNPKMCKKTDVMYIPIFHCKKGKQIAKTFIPHTIKLLYTQTMDYPVWDNNNTSICYIHNNMEK